MFEAPYIEIVASELNSAILGKKKKDISHAFINIILLTLFIIVSLKKYPNSSLERIYRQTTTTIEELVLGGNAKAALLEPERDCLKSLN